jgi:hypothetical protein
LTTKSPYKFGKARDRGGIFGDTGRSRATETALSRVSGGKAAESQRLFRRRQETGFAQDCVVELVGLELPSMRLCEISDELLFGSSSVREPQHLLLTRPCDRCIEEAGDTDSARKPTIDSRFDEAWREESQ